jgi:hypothetical protein
LYHSDEKMTSQASSSEAENKWSKAAIENDVLINMRSDEDVRMPMPRKVKDSTAATHILV